MPSIAVGKAHSHTATQPHKPLDSDNNNAATNTTNTTTTKQDVRSTGVQRRALAALEGHETVGVGQLRRVAVPALRHRLRRNPLDDTGSGVRVERAVSELLGD